MADISIGVPKRKYCGWICYKNIPEDATLDEIREFIDYIGAEIKTTTIRQTSILVPLKEPMDALNFLRSYPIFRDIPLDYSVLNLLEAEVHLLQCARRKLNFEAKK